MSMGAEDDFIPWFSPWQGGADFSIDAFAGDVHIAIKHTMDGVSIKSMRNRFNKARELMTVIISYRARSRNDGKEWKKGAGRLLLNFLLTGEAFFVFFDLRLFGQLRLAALAFAGAHPRCV